jgi:hypothetical protein
MIPVSQEMSAEERRTRLLHGLRASNVGNDDGTKEAIVNFSHLAHALSMDEAEKLIIRLTSMESIVRVPHSKHPRYIAQGMATVNIGACIKALEEKTFTINKSKIDRKVRDTGS